MSRAEKTLFSREGFRFVLDLEHHSPQVVAIQGVYSAEAVFDVGPSVRLDVVIQGQADWVRAAALIEANRVEILAAWREERIKRADELLATVPPSTLTDHNPVFVKAVVDDLERQHDLAVAEPVEVAEPTDAIDRIKRQFDKSIAQKTDWHYPAFLDESRIVSDPAILGGEPVFKGSRLSVRHIGGLPESELQNILTDYPYLTEQDVLDARKFVKERS